MEMSSRSVPAVHPRSRHRRQGPVGPRRSRGDGRRRAAGRRRGYRRVWYAEHHNMSSIASSATSVLIAHVAAHTSTIRLGAGGIMLPNHAPAADRRAVRHARDAAPGPHRPRPRPRAGQRPGHDARAAPRPDGVGLVPAGRARAAGLSSPVESRIPGVNATPGKGTNVPLYILGSSLFGATARRGPRPALRVRVALRARRRCENAVATYRREFHPSEQLDQPYVIAGVNVIAADTDDDALDSSAPSAGSASPASSAATATSPTTRPTRSSPPHRVARSRR